MPTIRVFQKDPKANYDLPSHAAITKSIGQNLRRLRKEHRMSQLELAKNIGKKSAAYIAFTASSLSKDTISPWRV